MLHKLWNKILYFIKVLTYVYLVYKKRQFYLLFIIRHHNCLNCFYSTVQMKPIEFVFFSYFVQPNVSSFP